MTDTLNYNGQTINLNGLSVTSSGTPVVQGITDNYAFATAVLSALNPAYVTQNNVNNVAAWMWSEQGTNWAHGNNPLNTTQDGNGGVATYPSITQGVSETVTTLTNGYYSAILNDLANNAPFSQFKADVVASPWAGGHYDNGTSFANPGVPVVSINGQTLGVNNNTMVGAGNTSTAGCNARVNGQPTGISIPHTSIYLFNKCQIKALVGGLCVAAGGLTMVLGVAVVVAYGISHTKVGSLGKQVISEGPTGALAKGVGNLVQSNRPSVRDANTQAGLDEEQYQNYLQERNDIQARNRRYRNEQRQVAAAGF